MIQEFYINEWPIDELEDSCSIIAIGGPGSGKSTLMLDILYTSRSKFPVAKVYSGSEDSNGTYEKIIPKLYITDGFDMDQQKDYALRQKRCKINGCSNGKAINIIDDCSDQNGIYDSEIFKSMLKNGTRHWNGRILIGLQYGVDMKPGLRKCASYVAIFYEGNPIERKKLYENFGGACGTYKEFCDIMELMIRGDEPDDTYTCMIIKNLNKGMKREDNVFYYKARYDKVKKPFLFGCKEYREWDKNRRDPKKSSFTGL